MTCAELVREFLLTLTPVTTLVEGRVWAFRWGQSPKQPAVLVQQIDDIHDPHLRGHSAMRWARIQIDVIAKTALQAREVDQAILGGYVNGASTGLIGATASVGSPAAYIRYATPIGYREFYEGEELKQSRVSRDYGVRFEL